MDEELSDELPDPDELLDTVLGLELVALDPELLEPELDCWVVVPLLVVVAW